MTHRASEVSHLVRVGQAFDLTATASDIAARGPFLRRVFTFGAPGGASPYGGFTVDAVGCQGSRRGNAHLHWHIAALPPGVPYERQQFHSLMTENGVLSPSPAEQAATAGLLRAAVAARGVLDAPR
ncbi:hypothetical protein ACXNSR_37285 [Streptomyces sp. NC-S4]